MGHIFFAIFATFSITLPSIVEEWVAFVDPDEVFEVLFPDSAQVSISPVTTALGELEYVVVSSKEVLSDGAILYSVSYCDYPEGVFHKDSTDLIDAFFDETIAGAVESVQGELLYSDDVSDNFHPTRLWKIVSEAHNLHVKSKAMLVGNRYYCLQIVTPSNLSTYDGGEKFLTSFKLRT